MSLIPEPTLRAIGESIKQSQHTQAGEFRDSLEEVINNAKNLSSDLRLHVYCMGRDGQDFRVGKIQITPSGLAVVSGIDETGNSVYAVSHYQRMQFVCEISKAGPDEPRQQIGFVKS